MGSLIQSILVLYSLYQSLYFIILYFPIQYLENASKFKLNINITIHITVNVEIDIAIDSIIMINDNIYIKKYFD